MSGEMFINSKQYQFGCYKQVEKRASIIEFYKSV